MRAESVCFDTGLNNIILVVVSLYIIRMRMLQLELQCMKIVL